MVTVPDTPMIVRVRPAGTVRNASSMCSSMSAIASAISVSLGGSWRRWRSVMRTDPMSIENAACTCVEGASMPSPPSTSSVEPPPGPPPDTGFELAAAHDAGRPEEAQIGLLRSRDDFGAHAEYLLDAILECVTVDGIAGRRCGYESDRVHRVLGKDPGEFRGGRVRPVKRVLSEPVRLVHVLSQANHAQDPRHDLVHALIVHTRNLQTDRVRAAVDARNGNGFHLYLLCFPLSRRPGDRDHRGVRPA